MPDRAMRISPMVTPRRADAVTDGQSGRRRVAESTGVGGWSDNSAASGEALGRGRDPVPAAALGDVTGAVGGQQDVRRGRAVLREGRDADRRA